MPSCFVIMPITTPLDIIDAYGDDCDHFQHVLDHLFQPAVEQAGYEAIPPAVTDSAVIQAEIIRNLENADLVLCDMATLNANVFFELGIRVALDKPVALVRDDQTPSIPFDNSIVGCHKYNSNISPWVLKSEIPRLASWIKSTGKHQQNALWKHFGITQRAQESEPGDRTQAKLDLLMTEVAALRREQGQDQSPDTGEYTSFPQRNLSQREALLRVAIDGTRDKFDALFGSGNWSYITTPRGLLRITSPALTPQNRNEMTQSVLEILEDSVDSVVWRSVVQAKGNDLVFEMKDGTRIDWPRPPSMNRPARSSSQDARGTQR
jgi:hypothetical protein